MPKRTNNFQRLIYALETQAKDRTDITVTESKMLIDRNTGLEREVDIAVEFNVNGYHMVIAIECHDRSRRQDIGWVEQMIKKHEYLSDKLVLVSSSEFSAAARDLARRNGVETIVVSEAIQANWVAKIDAYKSLFILQTVFVPTIKSIEYTCSLDDERFSESSPLEVIDKNGLRTSMTGLVEAMIRNHPTLSRDIADHWYKLPLERRTDKLSVSVDYNCPVEEPMMLAQGALKYPLRKLRFTLDVSFAAGTVDLAHSQYRELRVAHGLTNLTRADQIVQSVQVAVAEQRGRNPAVIILPVNDRGQTIGAPQNLEFAYTPKEKLGISDCSQW